MAGRRTQIGKPRLLNPRGQSCMPCRQHKVHCSRELPCKACVRHGREEACRRNPSPAILGISQPPNLSLSLSAASHVSHGGPPLQPAWRPRAPEPDEFQSGSVAVCTTPVQGPWPKTDESPSRSYPDLQTVAGLQKANEVAEFCNQRLSSADNHAATSSSTSLCTLPAGNIVQDLDACFPIGKQPNSASVKVQLANLLPTQSQCDVLVAYYLDHAEYMNRAIHIPSFRREYAEFWMMPVIDIDLAWLSLLFAILSVSATLIQPELCQAFGLEQSQLHRLAHSWFLASGQALQANEYEYRPTITQLQTFIVSQLYCWATNRTEILNSYLGMAVRNAQALGLHKPSTSDNVLERELRHRIWWEICHADTFQSMSLARPPLIQSYVSKVPFPLHCNDADINESTTHVRPLEEPTDLSTSLARYRMFKVFNKLYKEDCSHLQSREFVEQVDAELKQLEQDLPWFHKIANSNNCSFSPSVLEAILWGTHLLRSSICIQRIRMYRPFLQARESETWDVCRRAAGGALEGYRALRAQNVDLFRRSHKLKGNGYHLVSIASLLSVFLLVERPRPSESVRADLDMLLSDFEYRIKHSHCLAIETEGCKVVRQVAELVDSRSHSDSRSTSKLYPGVGNENLSDVYLDQVHKTFPNPVMVALRDILACRYEDGEGNYVPRQPHPMIPPDSAPEGELGISNLPLSFDFGIQVPLNLPFEFWEWDQWDTVL